MSRLEDYWPIVLFPIIIGGIIGFTILIQSPSSQPCSEGIHVTHNGLPVSNLAIKQPGQGSYTLGATNETGYLILSFCSPTGAIVTFQATDYGFQLEPHQIIEAKL